MGVGGGRTGAACLETTPDAPASTSPAECILIIFRQGVQELLRVVLITHREVPEQLSIRNAEYHEKLVLVTTVLLQQQQQCFNETDVKACAPDMRHLLVGSSRRGDMSCAVAIIKTVTNAWATTDRFHEDIRWPCMFGSDAPTR